MSKSFVEMVHQAIHIGRVCSNGCLTLIELGMDGIVSHVGVSGLLLEHLDNHWYN